MANEQTRRRTGRTTALIEQSAKDWLYMVCTNRKEAERVMREARRMGLDIPMPITHDDLIVGRFCGRGIRGFLVDDVDMVLAVLARGVPVRSAALDPLPVSP